MKNFRYTWQNLPDPCDPPKTIPVQSGDRFWFHVIVERDHFRLPSKVLESWLGTNLINQLNECWKPGFSEESRGNLLTELCKKIGDLLGHTMRVPLVLVYETYGPNNGRRGERWRLPLANGTRLILGADRDRNIFITNTIFVPNCVSGMQPGKEWRREVKAIISKYAEAREGNFFLPDGGKVYKREQKKIGTSSTGRFQDTHQLT